MKHLTTLFLFISLAGHLAAQEGSIPIWEPFQPALAKDQRQYADVTAIAALNQEAEQGYRLGSGDVVFVNVQGHEESSGIHTIGPDGIVTLPLNGDLMIGGKTRQGAIALIQENINQYYKGAPRVTLRVDQYNNNHVFLLGQVGSPGRIQLNGSGRLLDVLTEAIPLSVMGETASLTKCAVIRGKDKIIWVDLTELLEGGNLQLNLKLAPGDYIYLPQRQDPMIYVMGEVTTPGAYKLRPRMSFIDGLMEAGGPTIHARKGRIMLVRVIDGQPQRLRLRMRDLRRGRLEANVQLQENDLIYVGRHGLAKFNYFFSQISPFTSLVVLSEALSQ